MTGYSQSGVSRDHKELVLNPRSYLHVRQAFKKIPKYRKSEDRSEGSSPCTRSNPGVPQ